MQSEINFLQIDDSRYTIVDPSVSMFHAVASWNWLLHSSFKIRHSKFQYPASTIFC